MGKKITFKTISLGSEPDIPSIRELTGFVSAHHGIEMDLIRFQLSHSLSAQSDAGIGIPAAGGRFYSLRMNKALTWDPDSGLRTDPSDLVSDVSFLKKTCSSFRSVHESPGLLKPGLLDDEDSLAEYCHGYLQLLRSVRDAGVFGHVIHAREPSPVELELLCGPKTLCYIHDPSPEDLEELLELTGDIILHARDIGVIPDLLDRFQPRNLIICEPDTRALGRVLEMTDQDHILVAGYGEGSEYEYWKKIGESAIISL
ncbi:MAG: hypothetical protein LUQ07_01775 [Methanospirillum sp.]|nr:hypothetical protein [Methanospirillum sp.]